MNSSIESGGDSEGSCVSPQLWSRACGRVRVGGLVAREGEGVSCWLRERDNSLMIRRWLREGASCWLREGDNSLFVCVIGVLLIRIWLREGVGCWLREDENSLMIRR